MMREDYGMPDCIREETDFVFIETNEPTSVTNEYISNLTTDGPDSFSISGFRSVMIVIIICY